MQGNLESHLPLINLAVFCGEGGLCMRPWLEVWSVELCLLLHYLPSQNLRSMSLSLLSAFPRVIWYYCFHMRENRDAWETICRIYLTRGVIVKCLISYHFLGWYLTDFRLNLKWNVQLFHLWPRQLCNTVRKWQIIIVNFTMNHCIWSHSQC